MRSLRRRRSFDSERRVVAARDLPRGPIFQTEILNRAAKNCHATMQFIDRNKLSSAVRHTNVAGPENDCISAKRDHTGRLSTESNCRWGFTRRVSEEFNQRRFCRSFKTLISARGCYFAVKARV